MIKVVQYGAKQALEILRLFRLRLSVDIHAKVESLVCVVNDSTEAFVSLGDGHVLQVIKIQSVGANS